jgi:hypothetical protein
VPRGQLSQLPRAAFALWKSKNSKVLMKAVTLHFEPVEFQQLRLKKKLASNLPW